MCNPSFPVCDAKAIHTAWDWLGVACEAYPYVASVLGMRLWFVPTKLFSCLSAVVTYYMVFEHDFGPNRHVFTWVRPVNTTRYFHVYW